MTGTQLHHLSRAIGSRARDVLLRRVGLQKIDRRATMWSALEQLRRAGVAPSTVIDAGAAYGRWSLGCAAVFPGARYVLIEPLHEFAPFLDDAAAKVGGAAVVRAAVGETAARRLLNVHADLVGSSLHAEEDPAIRSRPREVPTTSVDALVADHGLAPPFLLKLDVQGAELDVLRGATETLDGSTAVVVETALLPFFAGGSTFAGLVELLSERGFALYDVVDLAYRPLDGALAQLDAIFVDEDGPARANRAYADPQARATQDRLFQLAYRLRRSRLRRVRP